MNAKSGKTLFVLTLASLLCACGSNLPTAENPNAGRYSIQQDRAPSRAVDIATIPEVIPEPVTRTAAGNRSPYTILGRTYHVLPSEAGYEERGIASWYGEKFHGHRTSNGEIFDMYKATAAHKSLPIPSFVRVTNLDNNRSIIVRVNDRGPFHGNRIIDLSYAAALKLGYADRGTARVQLQAVLADAYADTTNLDQRRPRETQALPPPAAAKYLQVGAFAELDSAHRLSQRLRGLTDHEVFVRSVTTADAGVLHRVRVGPIQDADEIRRLSESVVAANLGSPYTVTE